MIDKKIIHTDNIKKNLLDLLAIPSPCGFTDEIVRYVCEQLSAMDVDYELTRRGTIRAKLAANNSSSNENSNSEPRVARAIVTHLDSIGAMVRYIRNDGRLLVAPIGFWSSRFAEGTRVTLFSQERSFKGTFLPSVEWGVSRDKGVEDVPTDWDHIELRLDESVFSQNDVKELGIEVGDFIAFDSHTEILDNGYIVSRNLDNKAGTAAVLEAIRQLKHSTITREYDTYILFTISETIGTGTGSALLPEVSELVTIDFASLRSTEKSPFKRVTLATGDASGPYDYHLTAHLRELLETESIPYQNKQLKAFHSDGAAALTAGHDVRTAVIAYAGDASHSLERVHIESLVNVVHLLMAYVSSPPTFEKDNSIVSVDNFTHQITAKNKPRPVKQGPKFEEIFNAGFAGKKTNNINHNDDGDSK